MKNDPHKPDRIREKPAPYARALRTKAPQPVMLRGKPVPDDVLQFCEREGIMEYLRLADELIERHLPDAHVVAVAMQEDPDTGEEAVIVSVTLPRDVEAILQSWEQFTADWVARVPWPQRDKIIVC